MKNATSIKSVRTESPKTPGGISKSLLTPCRRVGLSRNWKKAGPSPFVSPLADGAPNKVVDETEKKVSRKRKERVESEEHDEGEQCTPETHTNDGTVDEDQSDIPLRSVDKDDALSSTPTRHIEVPRKKKSKTLLSALNKNVHNKKLLLEKHSAVEHVSEDDNKSKEDVVQKDEKETPVTPITKSKSKGVKSSSSKNNLMKQEKLTIDLHEPLKVKDETQNVATPVQKSKSKGKNKISIEEQPIIDENIDSAEKENILHPDEKEKHRAEIETEPKPKSPNELSKECIVVIQKKIFKTDKKQKTKIQTFDSDSDDVPLDQLNKETVDQQTQRVNLETTQAEKQGNSKDIEIINLVDEEEDFIETKRPKVVKLEDKATSIGGLKKKPKNNKSKPLPKKPTQQIINSDFDDDEDDFDNKKTILVRKSYEKVIKPQKAKSTGSITQRDIDELRARIEAKKKMLLARAMTEDTEELRTLIKKWQRGCQDALMELMELMKTKFADRPNMDYSEMLSMLKIPANLVGYDEENDCFTTPDDASIVLSKFNE